MDAKPGRARRSVIAGVVFATLILLANVAAVVSIGFPCNRSHPTSELRQREDARYFVQAANAYGGYSNMRVSLLRTLALANYLNRTPIYAPLGNCLNDEAPEDVFDLAPFHALPMGANLKPTCRPHPLLSSSMIVRKECPGDYICGREKAGPRVRYLHPEVYLTGGFNWRPRYPSDNGTWGLNDITDVSNKEPSQCIALQEGFYFRMSPSDIASFNVYYEAAMRTLLPASEIELEVQSFLIRHGLLSGPFAAIHLRLTDLGGKTDLNGLGCSANISDFIAAVKGHADMPVLLATDDEASNCTRLVVNELRPILVRSGKWLGERSCKEAAFIQEVLAHSFVFVGVRNSTFSAAIEGIRLLRHRQKVRGKLFTV